MEALLTKHVEKRPVTVRLQGRILFLTEDPELIKRQLAGEGRADHQCLEMYAIGTANLDFGVRQAPLDEILYGRCVHLLRIWGRSPAITQFRVGCDAVAARAVQSETWG